MKYSILGADIAGISAAYHLSKKNIKSVVYEKRNRWGGLCDNFSINGFRFDYCIHLSFTKNNSVKKIFSKSSEYLTHKPNVFNYSKGFWIKHPIQNNTYHLPTKEKNK